VGCSRQFVVRAEPENRANGQMIVRDATDLATRQERAEDLLARCVVALRARSASRSSIFATT
jgi:hypothetical protein